MLSYFILNFMPLMILLALAAMMYVNRDVKIPASKYFIVIIFIMLVLTVISTINTDIDISGFSQDEANRVIRFHTFLSATSYILRPCMALFEILIILNNRKLKLLCTLPAIINGIIFSTAIFGSKIAFYIGTENRWHSGPLRPSIFVTLLFYLLLLLGISAFSFRQNNKRKTLVLVAMCIQAVLCAILEYEGVDPSYSDAITALCIFEYYIYLSTVYRQALAAQLDTYVDEVEAAGFKMKTLTKEVIAAFANSIDAKDKYTHGHSSRVAEYSKRLAEMNGKSPEECDRIYYAGLLHDIGKIGVPENIITKEGKLTPEEFEKVKQHPTLGAQILGSITEFPYLSVGARSHHERYDGKGYPEGLKGEEIPEMARIISVADAYDAMSSIRSYRDPIPQQKVREEIVKGSGAQFDPVYARIMLHLIDEDLEYAMCEREEIKDLSDDNDFVVGEYRSAVSDGVHLTPFMTTIDFSIMSDEEASGAYPAPSILLFDSLDGKVHTDPKEIKDLNYFEYGEIMDDISTKVIGARKMETRILNVGAPDITLHGTYRIEAVRIKDHALIRILGKECTAEITVALPDSARFLFLGLTGEHIRYQDVTTVKAETECPADYIPRIAEEISYIDGPAGDIPNVQIDGYRTAHSEGIMIKDGLEVSFHAMCLPTARLVWHCPFIDIYSSDSGSVDDPSYHDLAFARFDGECWQTDEAVNVNLNMVKTASFESWDKWKQFNMNGFDTKVTFKLDGNNLTILTDNAGISISHTVILYDIGKPIYAALTGDQVALTNIRIKA